VSPLALSSETLVTVRVHSYPTAYTHLLHHLLVLLANPEQDEFSMTCVATISIKIEDDSLL
jgi:hypothetical protein